MQSLAKWINNFWSILDQSKDDWSISADVLKVFSLLTDFYFCCLCMILLGSPVTGGGWGPGAHPAPSVGGWASCAQHLTRPGACSWWGEEVRTCWQRRLMWVFSSGSSTLPCLMFLWLGISAAPNTAPPILAHLSAFCFWPDSSIWVLFPSELLWPTGSSPELHEILSSRLSFSSCV